MRRSQTASRSRFTRALMLLGASALLAACGTSGGGTTSAQADASAATTDPILIGAILSTSGIYGVIGTPEEKALRAFEQDYNKTAKRPIKFQIENDQSDPVQAAGAARRLTADKDIAAIVGPSVGATMDAALPVIQRTGMPVIVLTPNPYKNYNKEPFVFSPNAFNQAQQRDFFLNSLKSVGSKRPVLVVADDASGAVIKKVWADTGVDQVTIPAGTSNYTPLIKQVQSKGYDGIANLVIGQGASLLRRAQSQIGWDVPMVVSTAALNQQFIKLVGAGADGVYGMVQPSVLTDPADVQDADLRAQVEKFQTTYQQSSGRTPQDDPIAVWAWDAAQSLVKAFEEAGSVDHAKVRDALEAQRYVGAGGVVERSKDNHSGYASSNSLLAVVRGSAIQVVKG